MVWTALFFSCQRWRICWHQKKSLIITGGLVIYIMQEKVKDALFYCCISWVLRGQIVNGSRWLMNWRRIIRFIRLIFRDAVDHRKRRWSIPIICMCRQWMILLSMWSRQRRILLQAGIRRRLQWWPVTVSLHYMVVLFLLILNPWITWLGHRDHSRSAWVICCSCR